MGNGAKAAQTKAKKNADAGKTAVSQIKANVASQSIQCKTCFATFISTTRSPALTEHASNKHSKTMAECFPGVVDKPVK